MNNSRKRKIHQNNDKRNFPHSSKCSGSLIRLQAMDLQTVIAVWLRRIFRPWSEQPASTIARLSTRCCIPPDKLVAS